jgi:hypothetical protein
VFLLARSDLVSTSVQRHGDDCGTAFPRDNAQAVKANLTYDDSLMWRCESLLVTNRYSWNKMG